MRSESRDGFIEIRQLTTQSWELGNLLNLSPLKRHLYFHNHLTACFSWNMILLYPIVRETFKIIGKRGGAFSNERCQKATETLEVTQTGSGKQLKQLVEPLSWKHLHVKIGSSPPCMWTCRQYFSKLSTNSWRWRGSHKKDILKHHLFGDKQDGGEQTLSFLNSTSF